MQNADIFKKCGNESCEEYLRGYCISFFKPKTLKMQQ